MTAWGSRATRATAGALIRADFDYRDSILRQLPGTFSVPTRYVKHMMVVADLANGDACHRSGVAPSAQCRLTA